MWYVVVLTKPPSPQNTWVALIIVTLINFLLLLNIAEDNLSKRLPPLSPSEVSWGSRRVGGISDGNGKLSWWMPSSIWFPFTDPSQSWQTKNGGSRISSHGLEQGARVTTTEEFWSRALSSSFLHCNFYELIFGGDRGLLSHHWRLTKNMLARFCQSILCYTAEADQLLYNHCILEFCSYFFFFDR